jgi:polyisoprenoid-binding protein YceI
MMIPRMVRAALAIFSLLAAWATLAEAEPARWNVEGKLNRKDFGMVWSKTLDGGGVVVGDEVLIKLDIECIKAKP